MRTDPNSAKGLTGNVFSGFLWLAAGSGIQVALKIAVLAILARLLSPHEFGVMGIALTIVEFSKLFAHMGVGPAIIQKEEITDQHLKTGLGISLITGAFFAALLNILAAPLATFFRMTELTDVLRAISLIFLVDSFTVVGQALVMRSMRYRVTATIEVGSYAIAYGLVGVTLAYSGWGVWALVAANLVQGLLVCLFLMKVQAFPKMPGLQREPFNELFYFGGGMTLARLGNYAATQGDNLVVGRMLGASALGLYGRAYQFMVMPASLIGNAMDKALFPAMSRVQNEKERLGKAYLTGVSAIALLAIPISVLVFFLAPEIVMTVLGAGWDGVVVPLQILGLSLLFRMSYKMSDSLARATGAVYKRAWRQLLYAGLVIGGAAIGTSYGLAGVAVGVAIALTSNFLLMAHLSLQITGVSWMDFGKTHVQGIMAGAMTLFLVYFVKTFALAVTTSPPIVLLLTIGGTVLPLSAMILVKPEILINDELKALTDKLIKHRVKKNILKNA